MIDSRHSLSVFREAETEPVSPRSKIKETSIECGEHEMQLKLFPFCDKVKLSTSRTFVTSQHHNPTTRRE